MLSDKDQLAAWIKESRKIVFFGGAGISTESGIPDFRSAAGIYQSEHNSPYTPEEILSRSFFERHPDVFYHFYKSKMIHPEARPNPAHQLLAKLEARGQLLAIVTQNIDGLHQLAGNRKVLELHGSIHRNYCMGCRKFYSLDEIINSAEIVPYCKDCDQIVKPDVVLYEENLDESVIQQSVTSISQADLLLIGGTSLTVQPAAHFVNYFRGSHTVLLNASSTTYDHRADLIITEPIGQVFQEVSTLLSN